MSVPSRPAVRPTTIRCARGCPPATSRVPTPVHGCQAPYRGPAVSCGAVGLADPGRRSFLRAGVRGRQPDAAQRGPDGRDGAGGADHRCDRDQDALDVFSGEADVRRGTEVHGPRARAGTGRGERGDADHEVRPRVETGPRAAVRGHVQDFVEYRHILDGALGHGDLPPLSTVATRWPGRGRWLPTGASEPAAIAFVRRFTGRDLAD